MNLAKIGLSFGITGVFLNGCNAICSDSKKQANNAYNNQKLYQGKAFGFARGGYGFNGH